MTNQDMDNPERSRTLAPEHDWGAALIAACLALGFAASWGAYELRQRVAQEAGVLSERHDMDAMVSQQRDLGHLLADPRTKLVRLFPADENSPVRLVSVAWNQQSQSGAVFWDDLATAVGQHYQIWLMPASGDGTMIPFGPVLPGRAVYLFSPALPAAPPREMILTPDGQTQTPSNALARGQIAD